MLLCPNVELSRRSIGKLCHFRSGAQFAERTAAGTDTALLSCLIIEPASECFRPSCRLQFSL
jgi:hypothetical protein